MHWDRAVLWAKKMGVAAYRGGTGFNALNGGIVTKMGPRGPCFTKLLFARA